MHASGKQLHCICFHAAENQHLTGLDPKQSQLQNAEILQPGRTPPPSPQHIRLQLYGNMPGLGAAARTLLAPTAEALCCGPKSFLKVHTGSLRCCQSCTFSLARFLAVLGQRNAKALSCSSFAGFSSPGSCFAPHSDQCATGFQTRIISKKVAHDKPSHLLH